MKPSIADNVFAKVYTRDFSMILEEAWFYANTNGLVERHGFKIDSIPPYIFYHHEGAIEVWENDQVMMTLMDMVVQKHQDQPDHFDEVLTRYETGLKDMKLFWESTPTGFEQFEKFSDLLFSLMADLVILYHAAYDERVGEEILKKARAWRDKDEFFDKTDKTIRLFLKMTHPELTGYEAAILRSEVKASPQKDILKERLENFVYIPGQYEKIETLDAFKDKHPDYRFRVDDVPSGLEPIRGAVAFAGTARGVVRIIKRKDEVAQVKEGDILVSPMTTPDFLPAMKKAAAIVTDEGGIICHAAIVSRELKKPCIVGTKIATQVLKDGMTVEVDANAGVVKIIK